MQIPHPFELDKEELRSRIEEMVDVTCSDLVSEFLIMPSGNGFIKYTDFQSACEVLKRHTASFDTFSKETVIKAMLENSRVLGVLRSILGMTAPEWAELARSERNSDITQNAARNLDRCCRQDALFFQNLTERGKSRNNSKNSKSKTLNRIYDLIDIAIKYIKAGAPPEQDGFVHRLSKFDTSNGLESLRYSAKENVPYAVLLYERYLGRPFAGHRDAVSELVGEVIENAIEERLRKAGVSYRKTGRAEKIPSFGQAPDFCIPDELNPAVIIEAKITSDDGTARDKVTRIKELETQRNKHVSEGKPHYEVVACIDGRGFRQRREDMRQLLLRLDGKVFTTVTLDRLLTHTRVREYVTIPPGSR